MKRKLVEFVNTCPCCDEYSEFVKEICSKYSDKLECKIYYAGKDVDYIKKYGMILKGTLIMDEKKKVDKLSKEIIKNEIEKAICDDK
ncbi:thioredoxin-like (seleno)protein SaoT [Clostridium sp. Marseille-Q2269]|uniref:thioredoxin-like (seleno)protein SaoT n=1 Tax=Clostridium sp. Marseille-Q2269 TaxID=2942205 RepID=UPI002073A21B|nr:thioredoxin-like (seleno)protein SaoT [Clostridium sp. Marseille-Q2269]